MSAATQLPAARGAATLAPSDDARLRFATSTVAGTCVRVRTHASRAMRASHKLTSTTRRGDWSSVK